MAQTSSVPKRLTRQTYPKDPLPILGPTAYLPPILFCPNSIFKYQLEQLYQAGLIIYSLQMESLQNEITLLKTYVAALEKENQARNQQKNTLFETITRLTAENDRLSLLLSKNTNRSVTVSPQPTNDKQDINKLKSQNTALTLQLSELKRQIVSYRSEIEALKAQKRSSQLSIISSSETQNLRVSVARLTANAKQKQAEIIRLTQQNFKLIKDLQSSQQNLKKSSSDSAELYSQIRILEADLSQRNTQYTQLDSQIKKLQVQNRELRANSRSPSELSSLLSSKLSLEATIRQLNTKLEWSETNIKSLQSQNSVAQRRIKQLEKQLLQAKGKLTQYKFSEESFKNVEANVQIKEKELQALEQIVSSMKQNKKYLERTLKEKEDIVVNLQSQLYSLKNSHQDYQQLRNELNDLTMIKVDYERQLAIFAQANHQFQAQNSRLRNQIKNLTPTLVSNKSEQLFRPISYIKETIQDPKLRHTGQFIPKRQQDLRHIVTKLQMDVSEMRNTASPKVLQFEQPEVRLMKQRSAMLVRQKSPLRLNYSKTLIENEKQGGNRDKWQNLQRKISALKSENQLLKRSLFQ